jgi:hypothetical protein
LGHAVTFLKEAQGLLWRFGRIQGVLSLLWRVAVRQCEPTCQMLPSSYTLYPAKFGLIQYTNHRETYIKFSDQFSLGRNESMRGVAR